jgi:hypothetical protein
MISAFYYFIGFLLSISNFGAILKFKKIKKTKSKVESYIRVLNKIPSNDKISKKDLTDLFSFQYIMSANLIWIIFGLISDSWKIFLLIIFSILVINFFYYIFKKNSMVSFLIDLVKALFIFSCVLILTMNYFHYHVNLWELIFGN